MLDMRLTACVVHPVEREHVTPFIYRRPARFRLAALRQDRLLSPRAVDGSDLLWTLTMFAELSLPSCGEGPIRVGRRSSTP